MNGVSRPAFAVGVVFVRTLGSVAFDVLHGLVVGIVFTIASHKLSGSFSTKRPDNGVVAGAVALLGGGDVVSEGGSTTPFETHIPFFRFHIVL